MPSWFKNWLYSSVAKRIPPISAEDREFLGEYFEECNRKLAEGYGIDISEWYAPSRECAVA